MKIDFMCREIDGYNAVRFDRARYVEFAAGLKVWMSAPEDLILEKLEFHKIACSDKHLCDIASMIRVSGETFDRVYLDRWADTLGVREEWDAVKGRVGW
jgi:hypothetical protein